MDNMHHTVSYKDLTIDCTAEEESRWFNECVITIENKRLIGYSDTIIKGYVEVDGVRSNNTIDFNILGVLVGATKIFIKDEGVTEEFYENVRNLFYRY